MLILKPTRTGRRDALFSQFVFDRRRQYPDDVVVTEHGVKVRYYPHKHINKKHDN